MHLSPIASGGLTLPPPPSASAIPPLPDIDRAPPAIRVALPHGGHAWLPGVLWPNPSVSTLSDRLPRTAAPPIDIRQLNRKQANVLTGAWHDLGAETRPFAYTAFGLYVQDEPVAVATAGTTVSASVDQSAGLDRLNTIELTRICRSPAPIAKGVLRAMLRLWRDFLAVPTGRSDPTSRSAPSSRTRCRARRAGTCTASTGGGACATAGRGMETAPGSTAHGSAPRKHCGSTGSRTGRRPSRRDPESTSDTPNEIVERGRLPRRPAGRGARPLPRGRGEVR